MPPTRVRIVKNWDVPDLMAQSPGGAGVWGDLHVTEDDGDADYVVVLNQPAAPLRVTVSPDRVWAVIQEPPTPYHAHLHEGQRAFARIYTTDAALPQRSPRYRHAPPSTPWHVGLDFDTLAQMNELPAKSKNVSWITSSLTFLPGHRVRMRAIEQLRSTGLIDLYGRGFRPVARKWDALAPYRYSIAFENQQAPFYWTEKIADCFLAGAMPLYVGCENLEAFFPADSFVRLDPGRDLVEQVGRIAASDLAERNQAALFEARRRVLYEHQFFPWLANEIAADVTRPRPRQSVHIGVRHLRHPLLMAQAWWYWKVVRPLQETSPERSA